MKIIPVLDLLDGIAVHAMRGERNKYQPLESILSHSPDPLELAKAFDSWGFNELYIADLDAILKDEEDFSVFTRITSETGLSLMVDAGISDRSIQHHHRDRDPHRPRFRRGGSANLG
jgi:phosphoribosylformimino-5-aminoimidazole carboxamide ribotide isomerase